MLDDIKIVCLGDSITYGFPYGPSHSWTTMLQNVIGGQVINQGIPGNTTTQMLQRFNQVVRRYKPTHIIIMGGINDIVIRDSFDRITLNLKTMAEKARENNIEVILGQPTVVDEPEIERLIQRIRTWINDYSKEQKIPIIDFAQAFYDENNNILTDLLAVDGAHPTRAGYQAMFKQIDLKIFA